ncbi:ABC transporter substrate-binding protein [Anopheles sinensis]|uniref:ABC transporter substrate-binding protein n=1 Tax=Anopheles sinensis TaxID=74873 RepID=A0A084VPL9_ANOSI|nr:ABC transporter substrate-binding protein [Anopheles sinensis]
METFTKRPHPDPLSSRPARSKGLSCFDFDLCESLFIATAWVSSCGDDGRHHYRLRQRANGRPGSDCIPTVGCRFVAD